MFNCTHSWDIKLENKWHWNIFESYGQYKTIHQLSTIAKVSGPSTPRNFHGAVSHPSVKCRIRYVTQNFPSQFPVLSRNSFGNIFEQCHSPIQSVDISSSPHGWWRLCLRTFWQSIASSTDGTSAEVIESTNDGCLRNIFDLCERMKMQWACMRPFSYSR